MAKLYFYYSAMNAGKSTNLLQSSYNYLERGMNTLLFTPKIDNRFQSGTIHSRIGLQQDAIPFSKECNLFEYTLAESQKDRPNLHCILIDEAQFLTKRQVVELTDIVDKLDLPVLAYGLRSDFEGEVFEGSKYLLAYAENLIELKTVCHCGKKALMNLRIDDNGNAVIEGNQVEIGGNSRYIATCRKHFKEARSKTYKKQNRHQEAQAKALLAID